MFVVFYTAKIVYICLYDTCSTSSCLRDTLMDVWNVYMYVLFTDCKPLFIYLSVGSSSVSCQLQCGKRNGTSNGQVSRGPALVRRHRCHQIFLA